MQTVEQARFTVTVQVFSKTGLELLLKVLSLIEADNLSASTSELVLMDLLAD